MCARYTTIGRSGALHSPPKLARIRGVSQNSFMSILASERRVQRSTNPIEALGCWLEATRRRAALASVALADASGLLLAGAGPARECDELAAWAPLLEASLPECPPSLQRVKLRGTDAYLCAARSAPLAELREAARGCDRILGFTG